MHLDPFGEKISFWQSAIPHTRAETIEFYKDLLGNILLFVPFPFLLLFVFRIKGFTRLLLGAMTVSMAVEILQYVFNIGVADIDDLILNTIGALLGLFLMYLLFPRLQDKTNLRDNIFNFKH